MAQGLSRMKGNFPVRFLGGWRVVTLSGYPVGARGTNGHGRSRCLPPCPLGGRMGQSKAPERRCGAVRRPTGDQQRAPRAGCGSPQG
jgi:hypothetical protein